MSERLEQLAASVGTMQSDIDWLKRQMDETAERQARFGRPRYMIWGKLLDDLCAGGSADVQLMAREETSPGTFAWVEKWLMEDVLAAPVQPEDTYIPETNPETEEPTWVLVAWFPLDEEYYVVGAEICPIQGCPSGTSSS